MEGYRGFLYLQCEKCGESVSICQKEPMRQFHCRKCGHDTVLGNNLDRLIVNCECGGRFFYRTNHKREMFDAKCINCQGPVATFWNDDKHFFESIDKPNYKKVRR